MDLLNNDHNVSSLSVLLYLSYEIEWLEIPKKVSYIESKSVKRK